MEQKKEKKPAWLRVHSRHSPELEAVEQLLTRLKLNTVCDGAGCPNRSDCFNRKSAAFMILGNLCTRNCGFCDVPQGIPTPVDAEEPQRIAQAVAELGLRHVVITSVTRDDLPDGGSAHFAQTITAIRKAISSCTIEVLIPDFLGSEAALRTVLEAHPDVLNHNIETIAPLYPLVRPQAVYERSLELLSRAKRMDSSLLTKTGIMVGLGETPEQVEQLFTDLRNVDCDLLTIGQYLAPSSKHVPVVEYVRPEQFERYKELGLAMGFKDVASGPLVRSSFHADEMLDHSVFK